MTFVLHRDGNGLWIHPTSFLQTWGEELMIAHRDLSLVNDDVVW